VSSPELIKSPDNSDYMVIIASMAHEQIEKHLINLNWRKDIDYVIIPEIILNHDFFPRVDI
jgi:hypothetical protein